MISALIFALIRLYLVIIGIKTIYREAFKRAIPLVRERYQVQDPTRALALLTKIAGI